MCVRVCESLILGRDTVRDGEKGVYVGGGQRGWVVVVYRVVGYQKHSRILECH